MLGARKIPDTTIHSFFWESLRAMFRVDGFWMVLMLQEWEFTALLFTFFTEDSSVFLLSSPPSPSFLATFELVRRFRLS